MNHTMTKPWIMATLLMSPWMCVHVSAQGDRTLSISNDLLTIGVDPGKGASVTQLFWKQHPSSVVNIADPGRLIQQSYYAGEVLDRTADGQHKAWSPWNWNPIQGGGVGAWAEATVCRSDGSSLYSETIPRLWDMPDEEAQALMRQWTTFEADLVNVVCVKCEFISRRDATDRWGAAKSRPQEVPACYLTRVFSKVQSYLGDGQWRDERQPPGPPWGQANPDRKAMACFDEAGQGIAVFSPVATQPWNFGPHGGGLSDDPTAGPCMHVAPIVQASLGPRTTLRYRYWLVVGDRPAIAKSLDVLWTKYSTEQLEVAN